MRIKIYLLSAILIAANMVYAKGDSTNIKQLKRLYISASVTPGVSYRLLRPNYAQPDSFRDWIINWRNKIESPGFAISGGVRFGVRTTKFMVVEVGVEYSLLSYKSKSTINLVQWNGSGLDTGVTNTVNFLYKYHYIDLPVMANFEFGKKRVCGIASAGITLKIFIKSTSTLHRYAADGNLVRHSTQQQTGTLYPWAKFNISPALGIGFQYSLPPANASNTKVKPMPNMVLRIMPVAGMEAMKNISTPITEYLWRVGLNAALTFGFVNAQ